MQKSRWKKLKIVMLTVPSWFKWNDPFKMLSWELSFQKLFCGASSRQNVKKVDATQTISGSRRRRKNPTFACNYEVPYVILKAAYLYRSFFFNDNIEKLLLLRLLCIKKLRRNNKCNSGHYLHVSIYK